jgi:hypothetical protein
MAVILVMLEVEHKTLFLKITKAKRAGVCLKWKSAFLAGVGP